MDEEKKNIKKEKKIDNTEETKEVVIEKVEVEEKTKKIEKKSIEENKVETNSKKEGNTKEFKVKKNEKEKSKKKGSALVIVITFILCLCIILSVIFALLNINNEKILSGIYINNIDISNLTKEEATEKIQDITTEKLEEEMSLKYEEYETTINGTQINAKYDIENAINQAYNIGRDGNIVVNNYKIL